MQKFYDISLFHLEMMMMIIKNRTILLGKGIPVYKILQDMQFLQKATAPLVLLF